jgi:hypothetical protein
VQRHPPPSLGVEKELEAEVVVRGVELEEDFGDIERLAVGRTLQVGDRLLCGRFLAPGIGRVGGCRRLVAAGKQQQGQQRCRPESFVPHGILQRCVNR